MELMVRRVRRSLDYCQLCFHGGVQKMLLNLHLPQPMGSMMVSLTAKIIFGSQLIYFLISFMIFVATNNSFLGVAALGSLSRQLDHGSYYLCVDIIYMRFKFQFVGMNLCVQL